MAFFDQYNTQADVATPQPRQQQQSSGGGGLGGFLGRIAKGAAEPFSYLGGLVDSAGKIGVADLTHNETAKRNAALQGAKTAGLNVHGNSVSGFGNAAKKALGETGQFASNFAFPEAKGVGLGAKFAQGAKVGALAGGSSALAHNQNIATGALEGGLTGGAANGILSKLLGRRAISGTGGTNDAAQVAIAKRANGFKSPAASSGARLQKYGTNLLGNELNIKAADAAKFRGPETVSRLNREHGLTVHQAAELHPLVTGGEGVTTTAMDNSLHHMGNVNFSDFRGTLTQHLNDPEYQAANLPDGISSAQGRNLHAVVDKYHEALNPPSEQPISGANPTGNAPGLNAKSAMDMAKNLEKQGYDNRASATPNKQALSDLQLKMADTIKSKIFNAPGGHAALDGAKADAIQALRDKADQSGNTKLNSIAKAVSEAHSFPEFRNVSEPFVNAKQLVDKSNLNDFANTGRDTGTGGLFATAKKVVSKTVSPTAGKALSNLGNRIEEHGNAAVPETVTTKEATQAPAPSNIIEKVLQSRGIPVKYESETLTGKATPQTSKITLTNPMEGQIQAELQKMKDEGFNVSQQTGKTKGSSLPTGVGITPDFTPLEQSPGARSVALTGSKTSVPLSRVGQVEKGVINSPDVYKYVQNLPISNEAKATLLSRLSGKLPAAKSFASGALRKSAARGAVTGSAAAAANPPPNQQSDTAPADTSLTNALAGTDNTASTTDQQPNTPFSAENIQAAIVQDMAATGGKHVSELLSLYNAFGKSAQTASDNLTTNQKNEVVSQQRALDALSAYTTNLNQAGGGEGPIKGEVSGSVLGGFLNPKAKAIDSQRIDVASAIAGSLNPRGTVSPVTARIISESLPSIRDTQKVADAKISNLINQIKSGAFSGDTPVSQLTANNK